MHVMSASTHKSIQFHGSHLRVGETKALAAILVGAQAQARPSSLISVLLFINELTFTVLLTKKFISSYANTIITSCPAGSQRGQSGVDCRSLQRDVKGHLIVCCTELVKWSLILIYSHCKLMLI